MTDQDPRRELERLAQLIEEAEQPPPRGLFMRVLWGLVWFVPVVVFMDLVLIFLVGQLATLRAEHDTHEAAGAAAGAFFAEHGALVLAAQILIWAGLCIGGWLPGTRRERKARGGKRK